MYGEVWTAKFQHFDVAVKKLKSAWVDVSMRQEDRDEMTDSFQREADALRDLRHKNIVYFYGAGHVFFQTFIEMRNEPKK